MTWVPRPSSLIRKKSDGTYWTAGHPGYPDYFGSWHFWRLHKAWLGWWIDKREYIRDAGADFPDDFEIVRAR